MGIGVQLADPTSTDALCDSSDFLWFDQERPDICDRARGSVRTSLWISIGAHAAEP